MPTVEFTAHLASRTAAPKSRVAGGTVRECLDAVFARHPALRGYVLDDQGALRRHVAIFLDGAAVRDRLTQSDPVSAQSEVIVMQALSGG